MLNDSLAHFIGKLNWNPFLGLPEKSWLVVDHQSGGGFAGAPQVLYLIKLEEYHQPVQDLPTAMFPDVDTHVEYRIGGRSQGMSNQSIVEHINVRLEQRRKIEEGKRSHAKAVLERINNQIGEE